MHEEGTADERELLGMILLQPEALDDAIEEVSASDFFDPVHGRIFGLLSAAALRTDYGLDRQGLLATINGAGDELLGPEQEGSITLRQYIARLAAAAADPPGERRTVRELARLVRCACEFEEPPAPDREPEPYVGIVWDRPAEAKPEVLPLVFVDPTGWQDQPVPERRWLVRNRIPAANVTILNGDGAAGKTTISLQLLVAVVRGADWLGALVEEPGRALFFSAEEEFDEIHRRLGALLAREGLSYRDLHGAHVHCMPGEDAVLGAPDRSGVVRPTKLFLQLEQTAIKYQPALIIIEAAADVYAGNENDRAQVRQFVGLLRRLARASGAAVLLLAHPSLTGLSSGSGSSGSTAWNNSARSRLYFTTAKPHDGDDADPDVRELRVMKSNYGPAGEVVRLRFDHGAFVLVSAPSTIEQAATEGEAEQAFLRCLDIKTGQGVDVVPSILRHQSLRQNRGRRSPRRYTTAKSGHQHRQLRLQAPRSHPRNCSS
jgi:hypothetical protein